MDKFKEVTAIGFAWLKSSLMSLPKLSHGISISPNLREKVYEPVCLYSFLSRIRLKINSLLWKFGLGVFKLSYVRNLWIGALSYDCPFSPIWTIINTGSSLTITTFVIVHFKDIRKLMNWFWIGSIFRNLLLNTNRMMILMKIDP